MTERNKQGHDDDFTDHKIEVRFDDGVVITPTPEAVIRRERLKQRVSRVALGSQLPAGSVYPHARPALSYAGEHAIARDGKIILKRDQDTELYKKVEFPQLEN